MVGSRRPGVLTALVALLTAVFVGFMIVGGPTGAFVSDVGTVIILVFASSACLVRARARRGRLRAAWAGIGLGSVTYAFGETTWTWIETVRGEAVPFPGLPDIGYLGSTPVLAAALFLVPTPRKSAANRIRGLVDVAMMACSLLLVCWILVLDPLIGASDATALSLGVSLGYPLSGVVLITVVLHMFAVLHRDSPDSGPLTLVGVAMLIVGGCDSAYAYASLSSEYTSGGLMDAGWFLGFAVVFLAARYPGKTVTAATPDVAPGQAEPRAFAMLVPYVAVLAALICCALSYAMTGDVDAFVAWGRSVLILLIVCRQVLTLLENRHLTRHLEARVLERTAELQASEQRFRAMVQRSSESVAVVDADSTIRYQSESVERIFGWPAQMLLGHRLVEIAGRKSGPRIGAAIESVIAGPELFTVIEVPMRHQDGRVRLAEMTITNLLDDPAVNGLVLNTRDVHDAKELQDRLMYEAYHDTLTGMPSRALFRERLVEAIARCDGRDEVAILFLDLDGFKEVNDSLGHAAGDALLVQVAARLRAAVREEDTVARFGGDEFGVIVESLAARADAEAVAGRIAAALEEPFEVGERELHVAVSIGLACAADADDVEQLQRNADLAMYRAKSGGGDRLAAYDPAMLAGLVERLELEADLRVALTRDELALHYQPTVDLRTGEITGFEALVRWYHPTRGMVSPLDFIGTAEATGLIVPLGRWVLTEACRQAVAWGAGTTRRLKMAVNVSVRQFEHGDLAAMVAEVLAETGMPVDQLCLEMTESVLLTDTDENLAQLHRLKDLGVTLAMDDFGTGYSSLAYLRRFPMDTLKIDRSFVDRLGGEHEDEALVSTIVRLGRSLGMTTVAEGIEDSVQLAVLKELRCDYAQGYYLSRPLPAAEAGRVLEEGLATALGEPVASPR
ncbi:putative bifunctional diguanylate cyclase/phosphodiesterase [Couchioplanes caeruleus]|nr:GGDEF domain-containing phosphodiesterase [Couchioplanes caeruleus]ROP34421.1 PAS domain S-box-containing protein/diguanylate cyclase (GGDEF)-like protein [Couchioplanes caeruleus]